MKRASRRNIALDKQKMDKLRQRIETRQLHPGDRELIKMVCESYTQLIHSLKDENVTMEQVQELLAAGKRKMAQALTESETTESETLSARLDDDDDDGTESS